MDLGTGLKTPHKGGVKSHQRWTWLSWRSLSLRLIAIAVIWIVLLLSVGGTLVTRLFENYLISTFDQRLEQFMEGMIGSSAITEEGQIRFTRPLGDQRFFEPYSGWYYQVDVPGKPPFRSRSLWDQTLNVDRSYAAFEGRFERRDGPDGQSLRVFERDIYLPEQDPVFRYIIAGDTSEIDAQMQSFRRIFGWALFVLGASLIAALIFQVTYGLSPLREIRRSLMAIRSGRVKRLEGRYPQEVTTLVDEMNALIDHNDTIVERARTHTGNLAHALKTPLSVMLNEAETEKGPLAEVVEKQAGVIRQHVEHHLSRARAAGQEQVIGARTSVLTVASGLKRALCRIYSDGGVDIELGPDDDLAFRGARQDLDEMLGNLMDNACKWAKSKVRVSFSRTEEGRQPARLYIVIEDDGPGIPAKDRAAVFNRGNRRDESVPGSGLGLAIVLDMASICGGAVELSDSSDLGGLKAVLDLPLAENE